MDYERIFLRGIEVRRQHVEAVDEVSPAAGEFIFVPLPELHAGKTGDIVVLHHLTVHLDGVQHIGAVRIAEALAGIGKHRPVRRYGERLHVILAAVQAFEFARGHVQAVEFLHVFLGHAEIDETVVAAPLRVVHGRVEVHREGPHGLVGNLHEIELVVVAVGDLSFLNGLPYASERLGAALDKHFVGIRRELRAAYEAVVLHQTIGLERGEVHNIKGHQGRRPERLAVLAQARGLGGKEYLAAVVRDIAQPGIVVAVGQGLQHAGRKVEPGEVAAVAPSRLAVVRNEYFVDVALLRAFLDHGIDEVACVGGHLEAALGHVGAEDGFGAFCRVGRDEAVAFHSPAGEAVAV